MAAEVVLAGVGSGGATATPVVVDTLVALSEAVKAGLGIGAMSTNRSRHDPLLCALTPELENCSADLWVLTHPDSRHLRRIAAVYSYIAKNIRLE